MTERERILAVLRGRKPDRPPWATRLDLWIHSDRQGAERPEEQVYRDLGVGRQSYVDVFRLELHGVELTGEIEGVQFLRQDSPLVRFPLVYDLVPRDRPGRSVFTFRTPVGAVSLVFATNPAILRDGTLPFLTRHPVVDAHDLAVVSWILDHCEVTPWYESFRERERVIGGSGLTIATLDRMPFQRILLDFLGEVGAFYLMHDDPAGFEGLERRLGEVAERTLDAGLDSEAAMIELTDNMDGEITNPVLFAKHCLPFLQHAREKAHAAHKVLGSHMDGDLTPLARLLAEDCVDVVESYSPEPLTRLPFPAAWEAWRGKVIPWGCLASPLFEPQTPVEIFEREARAVVDTARAEGGIILGIADQAVARTLPDRIRRIRDLVDA